MVSIGGGNDIEGGGRWFRRRLRQIEDGKSKELGGVVNTIEW